MRQRQRDGQPEEGHSELDLPVRAKQRARLACVAPVRPRAYQPASSAQAEHEHGHDERSRLDGVAEDVAEGADPHYLVDEPAHPGREEREIDQAPNLELEPESQLHRPRRVREIGARDRLPERRAGLGEVVSSVVRAVEQVEHFREAGDRARPPSRTRCCSRRSTR